MANIFDVAKLAGVSTATVSRVLNNSSSVQPATVEKVKEAMVRLNYRPNFLGRNLRKSEAKMILVILPSVSNPFYSKVIKGIEDTANLNGFNIMICNTYSQIDRERAYINLLKNKLCDAAILMVQDIAKEELDMIAENYPLVQCCEYNEDSSVPYVSIDNEKASYDMVMHLIGQNKKRIAMISVKNKYHSTIQREKGYRKALENSGIKFDCDLIKYGNYGYKSGISAAAELLSMDTMPDSIFAISDIMAIGAAKAAVKMGLKIPEDIAVAGFDNINFSYMYNPEITTISQNQYEMGKKCMEMIIEQINTGHIKNRSVLVDYDLVIRESTDKNI